MRIASPSLDGFSFIPQPSESRLRFSFHRSSNRHQLLLLRNRSLSNPQLRQRVFLRWLDSLAGLAVVSTDSASRLLRVPSVQSRHLQKTINLGTSRSHLGKMASKLDQSLDDITKSRRQSGRNRARGGRSGASRAPVGGIRKNRANRGTTKPSTTTGSTAPLVDSKIIVSGLVSCSKLSR